MSRLLVLMISIGLADSINPATIAPALYMASGDRPRTRVAEFTIAVFVVYLAGGALIALGPGQLIRHALPDIDVRHTIRYTGEILAGVVLFAGAAVVWHRRHRMIERGLPTATPRRRSSILLGATITAVELPTAFPYFAAIAAVVGSGLGATRELGLLIVFNLCFVLPLLGILAILVFAHHHAQEYLTRGREYLDRRWPHIVCGLIIIVGVVAIFFGATGLATGIHGNVGRFFRHMRHHLHLRF